MAKNLLDSLPSTQRVIEVWVDGSQSSVRAWDSIHGKYRVYTHDGEGRMDTWWLHATRSTGKEPRDLVRSRNAEERRVAEKLRKVSATLRSSDERLSKLFNKHNIPDEFPDLHKRVCNVLKFKKQVDEIKTIGNAHLVLILNTKNEIEAKKDILDTFSQLPSYKHMHMNMSRNLANVYFNDTIDAQKFIGKRYPSIREVRKGYDWKTSKLEKIEKLVICPDVKDMDTMESLQEELISMENEIYRQIDHPAPPPVPVAMPPPPPHGVSSKRKFRFQF